MYTAILYIPRGYRVDTETVIVAIERIGQFCSVQVAEKAAQSRLDRLALPEHLQKHAHYRIEQVSSKIRPLQAAYRKKPTPEERKYAQNHIAQIKAQLTKGAQP